MPGISVSRIPIPFRKAGINWSSYWATLISATVEDAAPTHVVLTFPTAQPTLGASDFTVMGFTVSSASWAGAVLTLVLSYGVTPYEGDLTITFIPTGGTSLVVNNLSFEDTFFWFDYTDESTITKDEDNYISQWNDKLASGRNLLQANAALQPMLTSEGVDFYPDTTAGRYLRTDDFSSLLVRPYVAYCIVKTKTNINGRYIFDGSFNGQCRLMQPSPETIGAGNTTVFGEQAIPTANTFYIAIIQFNGNGTSFLKIDDRDPVFGDCGTNWFSAFALNIRGGLSSSNAHQSVFKEIIWETGVISDEKITAMYNYLLKKK